MCRPNGYPATSGLLDAFAGDHAYPRHRYWLHALLLLLTLLTTTVVGAGLAQDFDYQRPFQASFDGYQRAWHDPSFLLQGLPFFAHAA